MRASSNESSSSLFSSIFSTFSIIISSLFSIFSSGIKIFSTLVSSSLFSIGVVSNGLFFSLLSKSLAVIKNSSLFFSSNSMFSFNFEPHGKSFSLSLSIPLFLTLGSFTTGVGISTIFSLGASLFSSILSCFSSNIFTAERSSSVSEVFSSKLILLLVCNSSFISVAILFLSKVISLLVSSILILS